MLHSMSGQNQLYWGDSGIRVLEALWEGSNVNEAWAQTKELIIKSFFTISKGVKRELQEGLVIDISDREIHAGFGDLDKDTRITLISSVMGLVRGIEYMLGLLWLNVEMDHICSAATCFQEFLASSVCPDVRDTVSASKVVLSILSIDRLGLNYRLKAIKTWKSLGPHFADFLVKIWPVKGSEPTTTIMLVEQIDVLIEQVRLLKSPVVASCDSFPVELLEKHKQFKFPTQPELCGFVPKAAWFDDNCAPIPIEVMDAVKSMDSLQRGECHVSSQYDCYGFEKNDTRIFDKSIKVVRLMLEINGWYKKFDPIRHPGTAIAWLNMLVCAIGELPDECPRAIMLIVFSACEDFQEILKLLLLLPSVHRQSVKVKKQWIIGALMLEFNRHKYTKNADINQV